MRETKTANPSELPEVILGSDFFRDPQSTLSTLVDRGERAAFVPGMETTMLLRHADIFAALTDHRIGAMGAVYYENQGWTEGPYIDWVRNTVVFLDPPAHDRLRGLVNRAFTPRQVAAFRPTTERIAAQLADDVAERGEVDLYESFAQRLPLQVICSMLDIPDVDFEAVGQWTADLGLATGYPTLEERQKIDCAMVTFRDYAKQLIAERRRAPGEDLLSVLIAIEEGGDHLSTDELTAMVVQMLYAGHETTRNLIGNGLFCLLEHPAELARLRADRSLLVSAVEEMLRYEPPIIFVSRVVLEDLKLAGIEFPAGHMIHLALVSANRDPEIFEDPNRFDPGRTDNRHLSFAFGNHFCLGASVARMEGQVAFTALLDRFADIRFASREKPVFAQDRALRTLEDFSVRFEAA
ncbi:MAG: cytochrome P450 [Deltaproteobacteria bacterium]|jgi:cytochrome P450|nr:cytochrome P450 [Deltaproteobacteria bacterium]